MFLCATTRFNSYNSKKVRHIEYYTFNFPIDKMSMLRIISLDLYISIMRSECFWHSLTDQNYNTCIFLLSFIQYKSCMHNNVQNYHDFTWSKNEGRCIRNWIQSFIALSITLKGKYAVQIYYGQKFESYTNVHAYEP